MSQIHLRVPQNPHTWLVPNAHASYFIFLSFRTQAEGPVSQREIFWKDKSKDLCRPLNPQTKRKSHSVPNNSFTKMFAKLHLSFSSWLFPVANFWGKNPPHTHTQTTWKITEVARLVSIFYCPAHPNSWYKHRLRVSTLVRCVIRMNKQLNKYREDFEGFMDAVPCLVLWPFEKVFYD